MEATAVPSAAPTSLPSTQAPSPTSPRLGIGSTQVSPKDSMVQMYVPAGEFEMGSNAYDDEKPIHAVTLDAFWIDQTEVTNAMFAEFVLATGYETDAELDGDSYVYQDGEWNNLSGADWQHPQGPANSLSGLEDHPVVHVSWNDAQSYCEWTGRRLPTEAEWEKAARGADGRKYPWGDQDVAGNLLNFADRNLDVGWADTNVDDGYEFTAPVGSYPAGASPYDVFDMAGNVWEWVADWYDENYYGDSPSSNPEGPVSGNYRILRGGSWGNNDRDVRSANRRWNSPDGSRRYLGFRCARSP